MRKILFGGLFLVSLVVYRLDPFFGGLVLAGGIAEAMVANGRKVW